MTIARWTPNINIKRFTFVFIIFAQVEREIPLFIGDGFGAEGYIRLSFATSKERITEGIKRIKEWMQKNK